MDRLPGFTTYYEDEELWNELLNCDDRSAALIAMAAFENQLEAILRKHLRNYNVFKNKLNGVQSKCDLCYCLGLIPSEVHEDLKILMKIRNAFAHDLHGCKFSNEAIKILLSKLTSLKLESQPSNNLIFKNPRMFFNTYIRFFDSVLHHSLIMTVPVITRKFKLNNEKIFS